MKFTGVIPALVTPLYPDETINVKVVDKLIGHLISKGAHGFYIGGATGEGLNLKTEERMVLSEAAINAVGKRVPTIIQVAAADFSDAVAIAKHAESIGADAISATPPLFFKYDEKDVYNYYKALANAVHIPLMIYYNPAAGFNMNADFAARMFEVDNITAIKWTSSNYYEMLRLKDMTNGEMNILNGPDEMLLMGLCAGADGGIGTTYNFILDKIKAVYDNFISGNIKEAQHQQILADRIIHEVIKYMTIPATKVLLCEMGFDVGEATFPMKRYSDAEKRQIVADAVAAGLVI